MNTDYRAGEIPLPDSEYVDFRTLSRLFEDRTTSYKFFFFLVILDRIDCATSIGSKGFEQPIFLKDLAIDMALGA